MSSRSRDLISATLISAGVIGVGEVHLTVTTGNSAFRDYWTDWFDNDRWHETISTGEAQLTAGRNDVLLVSPGSHNITSALSWDLHNTHMIGAGAMQCVRPQALLQLAGTGAITPMVAVAASGCTFANLSMRHGRDANAAATCFTCLQVSTGADGFIGRSLFVWGPEDDTLNDSTGYKLVRIHDHSEWHNCHFGYGYPISGAPTVLDNTLIWFKKSVFNSSIFEGCTFVMETTVSAMTFLGFEYAQAGGVYHAFRNCSFIQSSTKSITVAMRSLGGDTIWAPTGSGKVMLHNSYFAGATDVANSAIEGQIVTGPQVTTGKNVLGGLAGSFDHTE